MKDQTEKNMTAPTDEDKRKKDRDYLSNAIIAVYNNLHLLDEESNGDFAFARGLINIAFDEFSKTDLKKSAVYFYYAYYTLSKMAIESGKNDLEDFSSCIYSLATVLGNNDWAGLLSKLREVANLPQIIDFFNPELLAPFSNIKARNPITRVREIVERIENPEIAKEKSEEDYKEFESNTLFEIYDRTKKTKETAKGEYGKDEFFAEFNRQSNILQLQRIFLYFNSGYSTALDATACNEPLLDADDETTDTIRKWAVIWFFADHQDKSPLTAISLDERDKAELIQNRNDIYAYLAQNGLLGRKKTLGNEIYSYVSSISKGDTERTVTGIEGLITITENKLQPTFYLLDKDGKETQKTNPSNLCYAFITAVRDAYIERNAQISFDQTVDIKISPFFDCCGITYNRYESNEKKKGKVISRYDKRKEAVFKIQEEFAHLGATIPGDTTRYGLMVVRSWNPKKDIMQVESPLLTALVKAEKRLSEQKEIDGTNALATVKILAPTVANEQDKIPKLMADIVITGIVKRGKSQTDSVLEAKNRDTKEKGKTKQQKIIVSADDGTITYHKSAIELVKDCPELMAEIDKAPTSSLKTQTINRKFKTMYRILKEKSLFKEQYCDFDFIATPIPSYTELIGKKKNPQDLNIIAQWKKKKG